VREHITSRMRHLLFKCFPSTITEMSWCAVMPLLLNINALDTLLDIPVMAIDQSHTSKHRHIPTAQLRIDAMLIYDTPHVTKANKCRTRRTNERTNSYYSIFAPLLLQADVMSSVFPEKVHVSSRGWHYSAINDSSRQRTCWTCHSHEDQPGRILLHLLMANRHCVSV